MSDRKRILILCTGNSARSQMAEGLLRRLAGDQFEVASAGTRPVGRNYGSRGDERIGNRYLSHRSKHLKEFEGTSFDYVITVCDRAAKACPAPPEGTTY